MDYFFGCVLEETHGTINLEVERKCEMQDRNLYLSCTLFEADEK